MGLDRRQLLRLGGLLAVGCATGCTDSVAEGLPSRGPSRPPSPSPSPSPLPSPSPSPTPAALPPVLRWRPGKGEPLPQLKQVAADFVQELCTRVPGQPVSAVLAGRGLEAPRHLALGALLEEGVASTGEVVYPQFGGLDPLAEGARTASVMVVVRHRLLAASGTARTVTRVCDVRLVRSGTTWRVSDLLSTGGEPVARPAGLPAAAVRVLDDRRIRLPDTARWDVHAGRISVGLLDLLHGVAALGPVGVTCLRTGHPRTVFATGRTSAHTRGRAVDLWMVGGQPVVGGAPALARLQRAALADRRTAQVGSPSGTDADGRRSRRSFTDLVHADHVHLASRR